MLVLHIDEQRTGADIVEAGDVLVSRFDTIHGQAVYSIGIGIEIGEAEDANGICVAFDLLHDQVVLLALLDIGAIVAQFGAGGFECVFILLFQLGHAFARFAADHQHELVQRIACARCGRRSVNQDRLVRQRGIKVAPVGSSLLFAKGICSNRAVDDFRREVEIDAIGGTGKGNAVEANLDLGHAVHAVGGAGFEFAGLHPARCIDDIRGIRANALAEQGHAATGSGRFDDRRGKVVVAGEGFGHARGERIDGGRADSADGIARVAATGVVAGSQRHEGEGRCGSTEIQGHDVPRFG